MKTKFEKGDLVVATNENLHHDFPEWYPEVGTIGMIIDVCEEDYLVQWEQMSVSADCIWYCDMEEVRLVSDDDRGRAFNFLYEIAKEKCLK